MCESAPSTDPQGAIGIDQQGSDEVIGQPVCRCERVDCSVANAAQSVGSADPQVAVRRRGERKNHIARKPIAHRQVFHFAEGASLAGDGVETAAAGANPKRAGIVFDDGCGRIGGKAVACAESAEALVAQDVKTTGFRPDPDVALVVLQDGEYRSSGEGVGYGETVQLA